MDFINQAFDQIERALRIALAVLLAPLALAVGASSSVMQTHGQGAIVAERRDYVFDNDRLLLGAYNNGLSEHYAILPALAKEAGLGFLVSWVADNEDFLDKCQEAGIGVIAKGYNGNPSFMSLPAADARWMELTAETYKKHPALWGDDFVDEPFTPHFKDLAKYVDHYNTLDTGRMFYINLLPIHDEDDSAIPFWMKVLFPLTSYSSDKFDSYRRHIGEYIKSIDNGHISVDHYPYRVDGTSSNWLNNLDMLAEACRDTNRDLWVITQAAGNEVHHVDGTNQRYCDKKSDQLQQGYACMAFGARAIVYACFQDGWWDAESHMLTAAGEPTATYYAVQAANAEFAPFAKKYGEYRWRGAYTVNGMKVAGAYFGVLSNGLPKEERLPVSTSDGLLIGCFDAKAGVGKAYVIVNMNELLEERTAACTVTFPQGKTVTVYGGGETTVHESGGAVRFTLAPGDGRFVTVE